eukprot:TRINITY_DN826_c0_g2_i2.p1 TRINITY_DN826_c0_g2~~TRINITY_DN826_c0_g2_i2.p1  ORF type:complete len:1395 (-),score=305.36 TRINITY_DN826_c0_g2_i2:508-4692(-)
MEDTGLDTFSSSSSSSSASSYVTNSSPRVVMSSEFEDGSSHNNPRNPHRKVKFLCSFGGRILPRPCDGKLRYVGGETRIVSVSREIQFSEFVAKLAEICGDEGFVVKYQLPEEEDPDSLVSVLCEDDLANMMEEYDKLEATDCLTKLRVFLFMNWENNSENFDSLVEGEGDQRYVEALNGVVLPMSRSASMNSLCNLVENAADNGGSVHLSRGVAPQIVLPNHHHVIPHQLQVPVVQSPPMSPHPLSPLGHAMHSANAKFEDAELHQYQYQEPQQCWTVGNHYNMPDIAVATGSTIPAYHESGRAINYSHQTEVHPEEYSRAVSNHKQFLRALPSQGSHVGNFCNCQRELQNRVDTNSLCYEESSVAVVDAMPCSQVPYVHHSSQQQQNMYAMHVGYRAADTPRVSEFGSPRFAINPNSITHACLHNQRNENMHQTDVQHHLTQHNEIEAHSHASLCNQCGCLQRMPAICNQECAPARMLQGKPTTHSTSTHLGMYEALGRNEPGHQTVDYNHCRNARCMQHPQSVWSQNCVMPEANERRCDCNNTQTGAHMEPRSSFNSFQKYRHQQSGDKHFVLHGRQTVQCDENGLLNNREVIAQGMLEGNPRFEMHHDGQILSEANVSARFQDQSSSGQDIVYQRRPESQMVPQDIAVQMESINGRHTVSSLSKVNTDLGHEDRVDRVMHSRNIGFEPFERVYPRIRTKVDSGRSAVSNYHPDRSSRYPHELKPDAIQPDIPYSQEKFESVNQVKSAALSSNLVQVEEAPLISYGTETPKAANAAENNPDMLALAERRTQESNTLSSLPTCEMNGTDIGSKLSYMQDDHALKDPAEAVNGKDFQKGFEVGVNIDISLEIKGIHPATDLTTFSQPKVTEVANEKLSNVFPTLETEDAISNKLDCQSRGFSNPVLPNSLTLSTSPDVLSSPLSSSALPENDACTPGSPIYDKSPEHSIEVAGQGNANLEAEQAKQDGNSENLLNVYDAKEHSFMETTAHAETSLTKTLCDQIHEGAVNNETKLLVCLEDSADLGFQGRGLTLPCALADSVDAFEGNQVFYTSKKSEDHTQPKDPSRISLPKKERSEEKQVSEEKPLNSDEALKEVPLNIANKSQALAQGLQIIKNDDLEDVKELGSGTYGTVYYGRWKGSDVAIKRIKASCFTGDQPEQERLIADFWREACILGKLHHPNVVAFYGIVLDGPDGTMATVTEYMVNGSLKQVLNKKDRTIDRKKRIILAREAAFGMEYLHEKNIVHFDLKSHNLLVNMKDPQRPICKIGDLGLSKVKQRTLVSGGVRGTLPWMAPELLSGKNCMVTEKVDVYSFGIVMWELLTGEEPYAKMHCGEIIGGILNNTLRPPIPDWCEPGWKSLMERCWSPDPAARPSFSVIAAELRAMGEVNNLKR